VREVNSFIISPSSGRPNLVEQREMITDIPKLKTLFSHIVNCTQLKGHVKNVGRGAGCVMKTQVKV
jgi:hypothetical protein